MSESGQESERHNSCSASSNSDDGLSSSSDATDDSLASSTSSSNTLQPDHVASSSSKAQRSTTPASNSDTADDKKRKQSKKRRSGSGKDSADPRPPRLTRDEYARERRDIHDALEHLAVVGNAWRHHDWRLRQWKYGARPEEVQFRRLHQRRRRLIHPRDEREYGAVLAAARMNEAERHDRLQAMDDKWDEACFGDGIRLQQFYDRSWDVLPCPIRTLVLRAWERAMSIASGTIGAAIVPSPTTAAGEEKDPREMEDENEQSVQPMTQRCQPPSPQQIRPGACRMLTRSMCLAQCELLNLRLDDPSSNVCRTCGVDFDTRDRVLDHYYGDDKVRGCCWILIRREQERLLRQLLQDQVEFQITTLLQSMAASGPTPAEGDNLWEWQDVVEAVERGVSTTTPIFEAATRTSLTAVDAATRRLVERYGNVPR